MIDKEHDIEISGRRLIVRFDMHSNVLWSKGLQKDRYYIRGESYIYDSLDSAYKLACKELLKCLSKKEDEINRANADSEREQNIKDNHKEFKRLMY